MEILKIENLLKNFGGLSAIDRLSFEVHQGEILGIVGPNGAGKTTLFNIITSFLAPTSGQIIFKERDITNLKPHQVAQLGIGRTFQATTLFKQLTVLDNVYSGFHMGYKESMWKAFLHTSSSRLEDSKAKQKAMDILKKMELVTLKDTLAENLPHGHQRNLGICIALATNPELLLLDEPLTGMTPVETHNMVSLIRKLRDEGITIVLIEHDMAAVMSMCDRIMVLSYGRKIAEGLPNEIRGDKHVIEAYLGKTNN